jgi:hypothetical protein
MNNDDTSSWTFYLNEKLHFRDDLISDGERQNTYQTVLRLVNRTTDVNRQVTLQLQPQDSYDKLYCFEHIQMMGEDKFEPDKASTKDNANFCYKFNFDVNFPNSFYYQLGNLFFRRMVQDEKGKIFDERAEGQVMQFLKKKQTESFGQSITFDTQEVQERQVIFDVSIVSLPRETDTYDYKLFDAEYADFFKKVAFSCGIDKTLGKLRQETFENYDSVPTVVEEWWTKVFNEISYHFPKADREDGEADDIYLVADPIWQERYFDISADKKSIEDAHKAYAEKHTISNIREFVSGELKFIINKSNQYIKTFLQKTSTRHNVTDYDPLLFTHFEKDHANGALKENTNIFMFVKRCIQIGLNSMAGAREKFEEFKVEDRQARLFLLNLMLVDFDTLREISYEKLFLGDHQRQNRSKLCWSFRLKPRRTTDGGALPAETMLTAAVAAPSTIKNQAFHDFRTLKRKLDPPPKNTGGVHIQNINEVHYHLQNDDYTPDLSGLDQARRDVDALIEKEGVIFQATEKLEPILEYLKKSANQLDIQRDKDGQAIYRSTEDIVHKVVSATQILDQLKADLLAETRETEPHAQGTQKQKKQFLKTQKNGSLLCKSGSGNGWRLCRCASYYRK